jgi:predicted dehydrogenase
VAVRRRRLSASGQQAPYGYAWVERFATVRTGPGDVAPRSPQQPRLYKMVPIRLAIVGCGRVAEGFYAPALRGFQGFSPVVMVDRQLHRAELLKSYFQSCAAETDFTALRERVDAAIVALPNDLNAMVATRLLQAGISVLVEKPAALTIESARELEMAAVKGPAKLAIGFIRREALGVRMARECIASGMLGDIKSVSVEDGYPFSWEAVNEFRFDRTRGGGVLLDIGSHVLDMLTFWFGDIRVKRFADDSKGGVETNAYVELEIQSDIPATVELSWTRLLRNTATVVGTRGTLDIEWYKNGAHLALPNGLHTLSGGVMGDCRFRGGADVFPNMFLAQLRRWYAWLQDDMAAEEQMADASDGRRNIELITSCRAMREQMAEPWREGVTAE